MIATQCSPVIPKVLSGRWPGGGILFWLLLAFCPLIAITPVAAAGNQRVALILSAEEYTSLERSPVSTRVAHSIADALSRHGFDVTFTENPTNSVSRAALRDFAPKAAEAESALVILLGHGAAANGLTYFLPVNTEITRDTDLFSRGLALPSIVQIAGRAKYAAVLFVMTAPNLPSTLASISPRPGLSTPPEKNTIVAFSTSDKVPVSRIDAVSQQTAIDLAEAAKEPKLKLSSLVGATSAGGVGKVIGEVADPDWSRPPANAAPTSELESQRLKEAEERARQAEERARQAEAAAAAAKSKATAPTPTPDSTAPVHQAETQSGDDVASLRVVEALMGYAQRRAIQTRLRQINLYHGPLDSVFGDLTRKAIRTYQEQHHAEPTGYLSPEQLRTLLTR